MRSSRSSGLSPTQTVPTLNEGPREDGLGTRAVTVFASEELPISNLWPDDSWMSLGAVNDSADCDQHCFNAKQDFKGASDSCEESTNEGRHSNIIGHSPSSA